MAYNSVPRLEIQDLAQPFGCLLDLQLRRLVWRASCSIWTAQNIILLLLLVMWSSTVFHMKWNQPPHWHIRSSWKIWIKRCSEITSWQYYLGDPSFDLWNQTYLYIYIKKTCKSPYIRNTHKASPACNIPCRLACSWRQPLWRSCLCETAWWRAYDPVRLHTVCCAGGCVPLPSDYASSSASPT